MLLVASAGCSLLAPSRDELSGGKGGASVDGQAPSAGNAGTGASRTEDGSSGGQDSSAGDANPPAIDGASDTNDGGRDAAANVLSCNNLGSVGQWQLLTPPGVSVT